jgi:hypothetical protein
MWRLLCSVSMHVYCIRRIYSFFSNGDDITRCDPPVLLPFLLKTQPSMIRYRTSFHSQAHHGQSVTLIQTCSSLSNAFSDSICSSDSSKSYRSILATILSLVSDLGNGINLSSAHDPYRVERCIRLTPSVDSIESGPEPMISLSPSRSW